MMIEELSDIFKLAEEALKQAVDSQAVEAIRVQYLGKKGPIQQVMKSMKELTGEQKKEVGKTLNILKEQLEKNIEAKKAQLTVKEIEKNIMSQTVDITAPAKKMQCMGNFHPLNQIIREMEQFFSTMGYQTVIGPEVELDYYNFEAVNIAKDHPARDMQDTFYLNPNELLRTHTSGIQARTLEKLKEKKMPIKIISPGKVYRRDDDDATHSHQFMQIEGLYVGENISMADLKGTLQALVTHIFGQGRKIRMRASYFPFVEPGVEVDVSCAKCEGLGCSVCKQTGYIEILGAGLIHPNLLEVAGIDSKKYSGFAFGMGPDRIAMLKYGVTDIRSFYTNDLRFLRQFQ